MLPYIGVVISVKQDDLYDITNNWGFEFDAVKYGFISRASFDSIKKIRFAAFVVGWKVKAIVEINKFTIDLKDDEYCYASFDKITENKIDLSREIEDEIANTLFLTDFQKSAIENCLSDKKAKVHPGAIPPRLDFESAANAVALYYGVDVDQICISIHRKSKK